MTTIDPSFSLFIIYSIMFASNAHTFIAVTTTASTIENAIWEQFIVRLITKESIVTMAGTIFKHHSGITLTDYIWTAQCSNVFFK